MRVEEMINQGSLAWVVRQEAIMLNAAVHASFSAGLTATFCPDFGFADAAGAHAVPCSCPLPEVR